LGPVINFVAFGPPSGGRQWQRDYDCRRQLEVGGDSAWSLVAVCSRLERAAAAATVTQ
jgi:hypothetical protein